MRQLYLISVLIIGTLIIISCKKDSSSRSEVCTNTTLWLKDDYQLVYINDPIYIFADTLYVAFDEVSAGIFKSTSTFDDGSLYLPLVSFLQPCGNSIYQSTASSMADKQEAYRLDGDIGDNWTTSGPTTSGYTVTTTTTIVAKNVSVTVPAGTFTCLKFHSVSVSSNPLAGSVETDTYLTTQYGPIKAEGTTVHYELARTNF